MDFEAEVGEKLQILIIVFYALDDLSVYFSQPRTWKFPLLSTLDK